MEKTEKTVKRPSKWSWVAEGALAVGVPGDVDVVSDWLQQRAADPGVSVLVVGDPEGQGRHVYCGCGGVVV